MTLHTKRHLLCPGVPELVALVLVLAAVMSATFWWRERIEPYYREAQGYVVDTDIRLTHYNATDVRTKVRVDYEYSVDGTPYKGTWIGFWPWTGSPNALTPDKIGQLATKDYPLTVLYDPSNPASSMLHYRDQDFARMYGVASLGAIFATGIYLVRIYPAWRRR